MRSMIKGLGIVALAAAALGMSAAKAATVALVTINQQALFFNQINDGAKEAADKAGVKLVIFNANNDAGGAEQRDRELHHAEGRRHRARRHRRQRRQAGDHRGEEGRHSGRRDRRAHPRRRQRRLHRRRQQGRGRGDRQVFRRLREDQDGRHGQGRRRRRAQLLHPEPAPRRLQEGGRRPRPASSSSIRSTARTSRTSRCRPPRT